MNRVLVIGSQGSGKTSLATLLARAVVGHPYAQESVKVNDDPADQSWPQVVTPENPGNEPGRIELTEIFVVNGDTPETVEADSWMQSFSAPDWANAFMTCCLGNPAIPYDQGAMIGWMANALMKGFDVAIHKEGNEYHEAAMRTAAGPEVFFYGNTIESQKAVGGDTMFYGFGTPEAEEEAQSVIDQDFIEDAVEYLKAAAKMDRWKSRLFYNKDKPLPDFSEFLEGERSLGFVSNPQLIHAILGIATEGAEMVEDLLRLTGGQHAPEVLAVSDNLLKETGDVDWFQELLAHAMDVPVRQTRQGNVEKLRERYPDLFTVADAIERKDEEQFVQDSITASVHPSSEA